MIFISGLINYETTLRIEGFPLEYCPVCYPFHQIQGAISGVGINLALALRSLGEDTRLLSLTGRDLTGGLVYQVCREQGLSTDLILPDLEETPQSLILYDSAGRRQIHADLKDIQEQTIPTDTYLPSLRQSELALLCNIQFSRPLLREARTYGIPVATDVHVLSDLYDPYNRDFLEAADILFLSNEHIIGAEVEMARSLAAAYAPRIIVIGMGDRGALLLESGEEPVHFPARPTRPVVNTVGAGDALFACFNSWYLRSGDARLSLKYAILFASWKIGTRGAAEGFLDRTGLEKLYASQEAER